MRAWIQVVDQGTARKPAGGDHRYWGQAGNRTTTQVDDPPLPANVAVGEPGLRSN